MRYSNGARIALPFISVVAAAVIFLNQPRNASGIITVDARQPEKYFGEEEASKCKEKARVNWHFLSGCMRTLRNQWQRARKNDIRQETAVATRVRALIDEAMHSPSVAFYGPNGFSDGEFGYSKFRADARAGRADNYRLAELNDVGVPYNGMGQTGLAYFILQFSQLAANASYEGHRTDAKLYRALGEAMIQTIVTPTSKGGLLSRTACRVNRDVTCSWFHSITRRDKPSEFGTTLNQNLHVLRDLEMISHLYKRHGWRTPFDIDRSVSEGLNQLFRQRVRERPGDEPALTDYLSRPMGDEKVRWLYYGFNPDRAPGKGGYFLSRSGKNCHYQVHSLHLLSQILTEVRKHGSWPVSEALSCDGPLAAAYRGTKVRLTETDKRLWSDPQTNFNTECGASEKQAFRRMSSEFYGDAFSTCGF